MAFHKKKIDDDIHVINARTFDDIAERDADTDFQITENINKVVRVDSPGSYFILVSIGPAVWAEVAQADGGTFLQLTDTPGSYSGEAMQVVRVNLGETDLEFSSAGSGDVAGPASSTDNAITRFNLATGKIIQNSGVIIDDNDDVSGMNTLVVGLSVTPDGTLHVHTASAGEIGASSFANDLVVENSGDTGMAILSPDANFSAIEFGSPSRQTGAQLKWKQSANVLLLGTFNTGATLVFQSGLGSTGFKLNPDGSVDFAGDIIVAGTLSSTAKNFISSDDDTTQTVAVADTYQVVTFANNDLIDGWTHTLSTGEFVCPETAIYNLSVLAHIIKTAGVGALAQFRITINGIPTGRVLTEDLVTNGETKMLSSSTLLSLALNDVVRLEFTANSTSVEIHSPTITGAGTVPSILFSINRVK